MSRKTYLLALLFAVSAARRERRLDHIRQLFLVIHPEPPLAVWGP